MKTLTVTTDVGTFTRKTERTYTHVVVVKDHRAEYLEALRLEELTSDRGYVAAYKQGKDRQGRPLDIADIASGKVNEWIAWHAERLAEREAPITQDVVTDWRAYAWSGRYDLACKQLDAWELDRYRHLRVYEVKSGTCDRRLSRSVETPEHIALEREARRQARLRRWRIPRGWCSVTA